MVMPQPGPATICFDNNEFEALAIGTFDQRLLCSFRL